MQILGIILIAAVIALLLLYFKWSKKEVMAGKGSKENQEVTVVVSGSYSPNLIRAKVGKPLTIIFDRKEDSECSKKVIFSDFGIIEELSDFGKTEVRFTLDKKGEFTFNCEMGMYQGKIIVE